MASPPVSKSPQAVSERMVIRREEMIGATLNLGGAPLDLTDYATTGLLTVAIGPRGNGKTNAGLLMAEQLSGQGWVSILIDPEEELSALYGKAFDGPDDLRDRLAARSEPILVVSAKNATEFIPYGRAILEVAERMRKPIFVVVDEGQLFSAPSKRGADIGEAADIINEFAGRGRKRAVDLFVTALRYTGSLHRSVFGNKNLTLIGCQEDGTAWSALAPQFKGSSIQFADLQALATGEFFCVSRRGIEKIRMPMAAALSKVAIKGKVVKKTLPASFSQWDKAMRNMSLERLNALSDEVIALLATASGLSANQVAAGRRALQDELAVRQGWPC